MDILWRDGHKLLGIASGAQLANGTVLSTTGYSTHELEPQDSANAETSSNVPEYTIRSTGPRLPDMLQRIRLEEGKPVISIEAEFGGNASAIGTRHFDAVMLQGANSIQIRPGAALRLYAAMSGSGPPRSSGPAGSTRRGAAALL